jgi:hypothetical protein
MATKDTTPETAKTMKYKIKSGAASLMYPGFGHAITADHLNGPKSEAFVKALKHLDKKSGKDDFARLIEESK